MGNVCDQSVVPEVTPEKPPIRVRFANHHPTIDRIHVPVQGSIKLDPKDFAKPKTKHRKKPNLTIDTDTD